MRPAPILSAGRRSQIRSGVEETECLSLVASSQRDDPLQGTRDFSLDPGGDPCRSESLALSSVNDCLIEVLRADGPLALRTNDEELRVQRNQRRSRIGRVHRHASLSVKNRVLAIPAGGRIRVTDISRGAIARPARPVIPTARILRYVAADGSLIANLRRSRQFGALRQKAVLFRDERVLHDFGERRHGTDLDTGLTA